jgi:hypothetical protein
MKTMVLAVFVCMLTIINFVSANPVYFDDGQTHSINNNTYQNDTIWLDENTTNDPGTHLELLSGGKASIILPFNKSTVTINGGSLDGFNVSIDTHGDNIITINSGSLIGDVSAHNNSRIYMNGGSIINSPKGSISDIYAYDNSICVIRGGTIDGILGTADNGIIYLYGSLRSYATIPSGYDYFTGRITGTLQNGSALDNDFYIGALTSDDIVVVPEPATICLFAFAGLMLRRKK